MRTSSITDVTFAAAFADADAGGPLRALTSVTGMKVREGAGERRGGVWSPRPFGVRFGGKPKAACRGELRGAAAVVKSPTCTDNGGADLMREALSMRSACDQLTLSMQSEAIRVPWTRPLLGLVSC